MGWAIAGFIGVTLSLWALSAILLIFFGHPTTVEVTDCNVRKVRKSFEYVVSYRGSLPNGERLDGQVTSHSPVLPGSTTITILDLPFRRGVALNRDEAISQAIDVCIPAMFGLFMVTLFIFQPLLESSERRRVIREGNPWPGQITERKTVSGKGTFRTLFYRFRDLGQKAEGKMFVSEEEYNRVAEGDEVTVFAFHDGKVLRSIVYEACEFEVIPESGDQR